ALLIRLRHGAAGREAFLRQMRAAGLVGVIDIPEMQQTQTAGIQRSIRLESQALWALSVLIGLAAFAIVGQSLARQTYLDSADLPTLRALGFSRAQLLALGMLRAAIIGLASACVVVPAAVLLSPLTPVGLARIAEPDPGLAVDAWPLVLGAALAAFLTVLACTVPVWTAARMATRGERPGLGPRRSPALVHALSRAGRSPAVAAGVRMALQPGRGRTAVPVRSAIFGAPSASPPCPPRWCSPPASATCWPRLACRGSPGTPSCPSKAGCPEPPLRCGPTRRSPATPVGGSPACASARSGSWPSCWAVRVRPGR